MNLKPWMPAVEAQLDAFKLADYLVKHDKRSELQSGWQVDRALLNRAVPYVWSSEVTGAVLEASHSIPLDTVLNRWNLQSERSWWYFEQPLPFETLSLRKTNGIRALAFGFVPVEPDAGTYPAGTSMDKIFYKFGMPIVSWIDPAPDDFKSERYRIAPSQVFEWEDGITLSAMLERTRAYHVSLCGPGGRWARKPQLGVNQYMATTEGVARFMLAALVWLKQQVVVSTDGPVERHRRKEVERVMRRSIPTVRVVSLRRAARSAPDEPQTEEQRREFSCRWVVQGHWRNQVCGPKRGDRRLTYILPHVKGPDDKPLRAAVPTVYTVDR